MAICTLLCDPPPPPPLHPQMKAVLMEEGQFGYNRGSVGYGRGTIGIVLYCTSAITFVPIWCYLCNCVRGTVRDTARGMVNTCSYGISSHHGHYANCKHTCAHGTHTHVHMHSARMVRWEICHPIGYWTSQSWAKSCACICMKRFQ